MEIRGKAWTAGNLEPFTTTAYVNSVGATDPIVAIESAYGRLTERLFKEKAVQRSLITYSMGPGEFDLIVKGVKEKALKEGRKEVWDLARRIVTTGDGCYSIDEVNKVFGNMNILRTPVEEVLAKDKEYQKEKKTLHIGDEVEFAGIVPNYNVKVNEAMTGYVVGFEDGLYGESCVRILAKHGSYLKSHESCKKTGKHNPNVEKVMASFEKGE